jgi:hypothetical protein
VLTHQVDTQAQARHTRHYTGRAVGPIGLSTGHDGGVEDLVRSWSAAVGGVEDPTRRGSGVTRPITHRVGLCSDRAKHIALLAGQPNPTPDIPAPPTPNEPTGQIYLRHQHQTNQQHCSIPSPRVLFSRPPLPTPPPAVGAPQTTIFAGTPDS